MIPIIIPTNIKTKIKWLSQLAQINIIGGYFVILFSLLPQFLIGLVFADFLKAYYWATVIFIFGVLTLIWNSILKKYWETEIKVFFLPLDVIGIISLVIGLIKIYGGI